MSSTAQSTRAPGPAAVIWHDAECGGYGADLPVWERLAAQLRGPVLDLGAGTGRVALHLAARGNEVTAVDTEAQLLGALRERAGSRGLTVETVVADIRELDLGRRFALIIAPMQLTHLLGGSAGRARAWSAVASHIRPDGLFALALLREPLPPSGRPDPIPDVRDVGGWIHSSMPLDVRVCEDSVELDRLRQIVAPDGALSESLETTLLDRLSPSMLERELSAAGLEIRGTEAIDETDEHVGSLLVRIGAAGG